MATVFERVKEIIMDSLAVEEDEVTLSAKFTEDLNADSLDMVEIMVSLEEEFELETNDISEEEAEKIVTIGDVITLLKSKGVAQEQPQRVATPV